MKRPNQTAELSETKRKLVDAGVALMRARGFNATTVDDICATAGVTKGGFFHYFKSKDELAKAALAHFREDKVNDFSAAPFRKLADPLDRVFGRLDFVAASIAGKSRVTRGCLFGMFAQEMAATNAELRHACRDAFSRVAADFENDLTEAKAACAPKADFSPEKLAMFYVSLYQGSLLIAKTSEGNTIFLNNLEQFRGYLQSLFGQKKHKKPTGFSSKSRN